MTTRLVLAARCGGEAVTLVALLLCSGMVAIMGTTDWFDPNWRHELSNAVLAWVVIGALAGTAALVYLGARRLPRLSLPVVLLVGGVVGVAGGGIVWLIGHRMPPPTTREEADFIFEGIAPALGPGQPISGTKTREAALSVSFRLINRSAVKKLSLSFRLEDPDTALKQLAAANAYDIARRRISHGVILGQREIASPLAVGYQEEIHGTVWFFFPGAPKDMPLKVFVMEDSISGNSIRRDLPEKLVTSARTMDAYPVGTISPSERARGFK